MNQGIEDRLERMEAMMHTILKRLGGPTATLRTGGIDLAVEVTGYKRSYIYRLVQEEKIPYSKPNGGKLVFNEKKLIKWMAEGNPVNQTVAALI